MLVFSPGPSKTYPQLVDIYADALREGIGSISHRGKAVMDAYANAVAGLKAKWNIPNEYGIYFLSSATEVWEVLAQSFTIQKSLHFYSGAFGEKWFEYARAQHPTTRGVEFDLNEDPTWLHHHITGDADLICVTPNETSNGTCLPSSFLQKVKLLKKGALVAADITSCGGGLVVDWPMADVWFLSVQKCLGMPAGLGIMICSPAAIDKALSLPDNGLYNSFHALHLNGLKNQTPYTPNVLSIYVLGRLLEGIADIAETDKILRERATRYYQAIETHPDLAPLVQPRLLRSTTVAAVTLKPEALALWQKEAAAQGIELGRGYGKWASHSFRIANFPALSDQEVDTMLSFIAGMA